jgi:hypothetical protein
MTRYTFTYKTQDISVHVKQKNRQCGQWLPAKVLVTSALQEWPIDQYILKGFSTADEAAEYGFEAAKWRIDHPQTGGLIEKLDKK